MREGAFFGEEIGEREVTAETIANERRGNGEYVGDFRSRVEAGEVEIVSAANSPYLKRMKTEAEARFRNQAKRQGPEALAAFDKHRADAKARTDEKAELEAEARAKIEEEARETKLQREVARQREALSVA
jgi:hypothetical protein